MILQMQRNKKNSLNSFLMILFYIIIGSWVEIHIFIRFPIERQTNNFSYKSDAHLSRNFLQEN